MNSRIFAGLLLAVGLVSAGCAVDEELSSPSESTTDSEVVVWCSDKSWLVNFYAEPALINVVGSLRCTCFQPQVSLGIQTNYVKLISQRTCSLQ
jgi:hypothetical protein